MLRGMRLSEISGLRRRYVKYHSKVELLSHVKGDEFSRFSLVTMTEAKESR